MIQKPCVWCLKYRHRVLAGKIKEETESTLLLSILAKFRASFFWESCATIRLCGPQNHLTRGAYVAFAFALPF
jgi:hypothetical protein